MKKNLFLSAFSIAALLFLGSCSNEPASSFSVTTENDENTPIFITPDKGFSITYTAENMKAVTAENLPEGWSATVNDAEKSITITATADAESNATITVSATGLDSKTHKSQLKYYCLTSFDNPNATFVLNEGNMTTENGSLTYITPEGYVVDDAYKTVNGTELGNVAQDMSVCNGKIYVIAQNGNENPNGTKFENDGMLVVMDAKTLKKVQAFSKEELAVLDWPTHIAALDNQHIFIRDNEGIYRFNADTKELTFVEGTEGAPKSQFIVMNGNAYTYKTGMLGGILALSTESDKATKTSFPFSIKYDINETLGIRAAEDGKIWVLGFGFGKTSISKFNLSNREMEQRVISVKPAVGSSGVSFVANGNTLYYADGTALYRYNFTAEEENAEEWLVDLSTLDKNAKLLYNGLGVHPQTGKVYVNTLKSTALYNENAIWVFDFNASKDAPEAKYENYTNFPAGFYFPQN